MDKAKEKKLIECAISSLIALAEVTANTGNIPWDAPIGVASVKYLECVGIICDDYAVMAILIALRGARPQYSKQMDMICTDLLDDMFPKA
jgi:hypothetical protein